MRSLKSYIWIILFTLLFIASNMALVYYKGIFYLYYLPVFLLFAMFLFIRMDILFYLIAFLVPISIPLRLIMPGLDFDLSVPSEMLILPLMMVFLAKAIIEKSFDKNILRHPVSIVIYIYLLWMLITSFFSSMPLVSFKYLLSRFWFIVVFYFFGVSIFSKLKNILRYQWFYIASMLIVIGYTIGRHLGPGLQNQQASNWVCQPLFNDHTAYGAALAMILPFVVGMLFYYRKKEFVRQLFFILIVVIFFMATVFSYTRATWLSLVVAFGVFVLMWYKIHFWKIFVVAATILLLFFSFRTEIYFALQKNRTGSSGDFMNHIRSMTNISTDESNLERLNRWNCALKMFEDRPMIGWGPGTYQFQYGAYQSALDITTISKFDGSLGNAHSEYLGPLSEQGIFGLVTFVLLLGFSIYTGVMVYLQSKRRKVRLLAVVSVFALCTYFAHGFLNNFLDSDKLSALFWTNFAILVSMDIYQKKKDSGVSE